MRCLPWTSTRSLTVRVADVDDEMPLCLRELCELSEGAESELLTHILISGWDQGCFLRPQGGGPVPGLSPERIATLLEVVEGRPQLHPEDGTDDPFEDNPLPAKLPRDADPGLVVLSQRCDLVKPIAAEPLVEVAAATCSTDPELLSAVRRSSSAQHVHLADIEANRGWVTDLRTTGHIPKHWLASREPVQLLKPGLLRRRFAQRIGERRSRTPVPTSVVRDFQRPLRNWLYKGAERNALCAHFSDLFLLPLEDGRFSLLAIPGEGCDLAAAELAFDRLFAAIDERVGSFPLSEDHSDVVPLEQFSLADYHAAYRLDLANVTYGSKSAGAGHAEPRL